MKYYAKSHCAGDEAVAPAMQKEIAAAITAIATKPARGKAPVIRDEFLANLKTSGWSSEVAVAQGSDITITSMKRSVGLCLQTGNMARIYADLIKLQTLYLNDAIKSAVVVVPSAPTAKLLGSNIAQSTRLLRELEIFKKAYHVPTLIYAFE